MKSYKLEKMPSSFLNFAKQMVCSIMTQEKELQLWDHKDLSLSPGFYSFKQVTKLVFQFHSKMGTTVPILS